MSFRIRLARQADKKRTKLTFFGNFTRFAFRIFASPATRLTRSIPLLRDTIL